MHNADLILKEVKDGKIRSVVFFVGSEEVRKKPKVFEAHYLADGLLDSVGYSISKASDWAGYFTNNLNKALQEAKLKPNDVDFKDLPIILMNYFFMRGNILDLKSIDCYYLECDLDTDPEAELEAHRYMVQDILLSPYFKMPKMEDFLADNLGLFKQIYDIIERIYEAYRSRESWVVCDWQLLYDLLQDLEKGKVFKDKMGRVYCSRQESNELVCYDFVNDRKDVVVLNEGHYFKTEHDNQLLTFIFHENLTSHKSINEMTVRAIESLKTQMEINKNLDLVFMNKPNNDGEILVVIDSITGEVNRIMDLIYPEDFEFFFTMLAESYISLFDK